MTAPVPAPRRRRPHRVGAAGSPTTPDLRSPVVRRLLTFASVTALSVLVGVVTEVLTGTLSGSPLGQTVVPLLDRFGWLVVPLLALFVAAPLAAAIRERAHGVDPAILSGELVGPGPVVGATGRDVTAGQPARLGKKETLALIAKLDPGERLLLRALATLPAVTLSADAILAVNDAVRPGFAVALRRARRTLDLTGSPADQLEHLVKLGLLVRPATAQYRVRPTELDLGQDPALFDGLEYAADLLHHAARHACGLALPAVLAHYADLGARWASALGDETHAAYASRWFASEAATLHELVVTCEPAEGQQGATVDEFAKIGDALDIWYTREQRPELAVAVAEALLAHAAHAARPTLQQLARARLAAAQRADRKAPARPAGTATATTGSTGSTATTGTATTGTATTGTATTGTATTATTGAAAPAAKQSLARRLRRWVSLVFQPPGLRARELHEQAMNALDEWWSKPDPGPDELVAIEHKLTDAWFTLPRADVAGEVTTLINLAVVYLYQGRFEAAQDRLELAEMLTAEGPHAAGRAHALELRGVTAWALGHPRRAVTYWRDARELYERLGEQAGLLRCLQHLGSALTMEAGLGGEVVGPASGEPEEDQPREISREDVWQLARDWLREVHSRRDGPDAELAATYLEQVEAKLAAEAPDEKQSKVAIERPPARTSGSAGLFARLGALVDRQVKRLPFVS